MKNDQRYFVENLSCNIVRLKKDCTAEELRVPNVKDNFKLPPQASEQRHIPYAEMIPAIGPQRLHSRQSKSFGMQCKTYYVHVKKSCHLLLQNV